MDGAKAVGQQHLDSQRMESENAFKHQQLHAKTAVDLQKLDLQGQQMGVDHHVALAQLASKLMSDQQDSEAQDQQSQMDMADHQAQQNQTDMQAQQANSDAALKAASMVAQHRENMAKIDSDHTQAMTSLAAQHHAAMTGHAMTGGKILSGAVLDEAGRQHDAEQARLDRQHAGADDCGDAR